MTPECFSDAVHRHHVRVHSYAAWLSGDVEEARDVAQESFLRLWVHHERVAAAAARTWLLRTAHRIVIDRGSRRSPRYTDLGGVLAAPSTLGPSDRAIRRESLGIITTALGHLPLRDRALLLLREQHGLSIAEIGRVLDAPAGTVKAALHRARRRLCDALPDDAPDPSPFCSELLA